MEICSSDLTESLKKSIVVSKMYFSPSLSNHQPPRKLILPRAEVKLGFRRLKYSFTKLKHNNHSTLANFNNSCSFKLNLKIISVSCRVLALAIRK